MTLARFAALLLAAGSLVAIVACWSCAGRTGDPSSQSAASVSVESAAGGMDAATLNRQLEVALRLAPIEQDHLDDLLLVVGSLTRSIMSGTPDEYLELMDRRGFVVSDRVTFLLQRLHSEDLLREVLADADSPTSTYRALWQARDARDMRIARALDNSAMAGAGVTASPGPTWNYHAVIGQYSIFNYRDAGMPISSTFGKPSLPTHEAWVQFDAEFESGYRSSIRLTFYFDPNAKVWVPYSVLVGAVNGHRPVPLI
jgi:hypothetical protein